MPLYKILPCENFQDINNEILEWVNQHPEILNSIDFWNPVDTKEFLKSNSKFFQWNKDLGLMISNIAVTVGRNPQCCGIHTDAPPARYKLSWPIKNTQHTWNQWFRSNTHKGTEINTLGGTSYIDNSDLEEIDRVEVVRPMIIDAGIPHNVYIEDGASYPRLGLQCKLFKEPTSL